VSPRVMHALGAVVVAGLLAGCAGTGTGTSAGGTGGGDSRYVSGDGSAKVVTDRQAGPQASGVSLDGNPVALSDFKGKVVVVNFWASWCAPCRAEAPSLEQLYEENKANGVEFLGINIKDYSKQTAQAFDRTFKIGYPSLWDQDSQITLGFKVVPPSAIPSTLILDRQGRVAVRILGGTTYSALKPLLQQVSAEK